MTGKIYRCKVHESGIEALEDLLSHDYDLLVTSSETEGLIAPSAYVALVALLNSLKSPFREEVGGDA